MLELRNVDAFYGPAQVLWDISLRVARDEIVALIGANGSGKSSVLKAIAGLLRAEGSIRHDGRELLGLPPHGMARLGIGLILERRRLFGAMTVRENLQMGAYVVEDRRLIAERLDWVETLLPVVGRKKRELAGRLSGGEQQMVAIARTLMARPSLILMDEPFLGLSPRSVDEVGALVLTLNRDGITILFNEQNIGLCARLAGRAYLLRNGRVAVEASGPHIADEILRESWIEPPAARRVPA